jgi:putative transposase
VKYAFIHDHRAEFSVRAICRVLKVHFSGFYFWRDKPLSKRSIEDQRLLKLIKEFYVASGATYGSPWIHRDMREASEACSVHRVARIIRENKLRAQIVYKRRYIKGGKTGSIAANHLDRDFNPDVPNKFWISNITYVRIYGGFLYVATVLDLFSLRIVGWSMNKTMDRHLVIKALLMAVWKRQPQESVLVHGDQGSQYGSATTWFYARY